MNISSNYVLQLERFEPYCYTKKKKFTYLNHMQLTTQFENSYIGINEQESHIMKTKFITGFTIYMHQNSDFNYLKKASIPNKLSEFSNW